jgi:hypothetical protein
MAAASPGVLDAVVVRTFRSANPIRMHAFQARAGEELIFGEAETPQLVGARVRLTRHGGVWVVAEGANA